MTTGTIILLLLFAIGAAFVQRVTGFGFGIFIMTMLPHIMPSYGEATALSGLLALVTVGYTAFRLRHACSWRKLLPILATFLLVSFVAVRCVAGIDSHLLRRILGGVLICVSIYFFFISGKIRIKPSIPMQVGMGTISGLMGGFFAMQGPPAVIYFLSCTDSKEEYIAICSFYFVIGNLFMTFYRAGSGFVTATVCKAWLIAVPAVLLGLWLGTKIYDRMPIAVIRKCVYAFMAVSGVIALVL